MAAFQTMDIAMVYLHIAVAPLCRDFILSETNLPALVTLILDWCDNTGTGHHGYFTLQKEYLRY
jgi:hypothetical protein